MSVTVSIIIPVYNAEKYLPFCIESIVKQSYKDFEVILVDDGSTDNSDTICDMYSNKYSNITVIHKKNEGVSAARNTGIQKASGKYIQFVDSDDFIAENMTEKLMGALTSEDAFPICNIRAYYTKKRYSRNFIRHPAKSQTYSIRAYLTDFVLKYKGDVFVGSPCNKVFKKEIITKNSIKFIDKIASAEDYIFNLEYLKYINRVSIINDPLYFYRMETPNSLNKVIKPIEYWWTNYMFLYAEYIKLFEYYGMAQKYEKEIASFIEHAVKDCIRRCFISAESSSFIEKTNKIKYICEDELTQAMLPNFGEIELCMKIIRFHAEHKMYKTLTSILAIYFALINFYESLQKPFMSHYRSNI